MSIPKVIHYCWFGRGEKSELMNRCIDSWRKYCPDWKIIEWNEDNFDPCFCPYAEKAYKKKRYGFLADAARLQIIYEHGGVYLDTDVELIRPIGNLCDNEAWFAYGTTTDINTGSGFGAEKGNWMLKYLLDNYKSFNKNQNFELCTTIDTRMFKLHFFDFASNHDVTQKYDGVLIINDIWRYVIHHYTNTWMTKSQKFSGRILKILPENFSNSFKKIRKSILKR